MSKKPKKSEQEQLGEVDYRILYLEEKLNRNRVITEASRYLRKVAELTDQIAKLEDEIINKELASLKDK